MALSDLFLAVPPSPGLMQPIPEQATPPVQVAEAPALAERSLGSYVKMQEAKRSDPANYVDLTNSGATRNMPITPALQQHLNNALQAVYGQGYRAQVYSGGQPSAGSGGARVGSTRHDGGNAADVYVMGPDGKRVTGDGLAPLAKHWLSNQLGGVGLEMRGGGIHLDTHTDRAPVWSYGNNTPAQAALIKQFGGRAGFAASGGPARTMTAPESVTGPIPQLRPGTSVPMMAQPGAPGPMAFQAPPAQQAIAQMALAQMFAQQQAQQAEADRQAAEQRQAEVARRRALFGTPFA